MFDADENKKKIVSLIGTTLQVADMHG